MSAFGAPFGSMSVADLGSLTRLEVSLFYPGYLIERMSYKPRREEGTTHTRKINDPAF